MAVYLPNGAIVRIASGYLATKNMSALSNANPAVGTLAASHGVVAGDYIEVTSAWSGVNGKVSKAGTVSTNDVQFLGINTTNTSLYSPGGGVGSVREISGWTQISQITNTGTSGGEQQYANYRFLEDQADKQIPTGRSAQTLSLDIAYDPTLAGYQAIEAVSDSRTICAASIVFPQGFELLYNAYISLRKTPTLTSDQVMTVSATLSLQNDPVRV